MNTATKRVVLLTGLFAAGGLLAYGMHYTDAWTGVFHEPGIHYLGMRHAMGPNSTSDVAADLARIKQELRITPPQEKAWNNFQSELLAHAQLSRELHQHMPSIHFKEGQGGRDARVLAYSKQRMEAEQAAQHLISLLSDSQRLQADALFGVGFAGHY